MPPTGAISSVAPSGKVIRTVLTVSGTSTATHHTGSPSLTPKTPGTTADGWIVVAGAVVVGELVVVVVAGAVVVWAAPSSSSAIARRGGRPGPVPTAHRCPHPRSSPSRLRRRHQPRHQATRGTGARRWSPAP